MPRNAQMPVRRGLEGMPFDEEKTTPVEWSFIGAAPDGHPGYIVGDPETRTALARCRHYERARALAGSDRIVLTLASAEAKGYLPFGERMERMVRRAV